MQKGTQHYYPNLALLTFAPQDKGALPWPCSSSPIDWNLISGNGNLGIWGSLKASVLLGLSLCQWKVEQFYSRCVTDTEEPTHIKPHRNGAGPSSQNLSAGPTRSWLLPVRFCLHKRPLQPGKIYQHIHISLCHFVTRVLIQTNVSLDFRSYDFHQVLLP